MTIKAIYRLFSLFFLINISSGLAAKIRSRAEICTVSAQTEAFIRALQKELDMESYSIRIQGLAEENAMVMTIPFSGHYTMRVNEQWLNGFSDQTKRFIIGHELMHIRHRHIHKAVLLSFSWPTVGSVFMPYLRKSLWIGGVTKTLFTLWFARHLEKDADISCAKKLHCADGGIEFFESLSKGYDGLKIPNVLLDHPSHTRRLKALLKLAQSPAYQQAA